MGPRVGGSCWGRFRLAAGPGPAHAGQDVGRSPGRRVVCPSTAAMDCARKNQAHRAKAPARAYSFGVRESAKASPPAFCALLAALPALRAGAIAAADASVGTYCAGRRARGRFLRNSARPGRFSLISRAQPTLGAPVCILRPPSAHSLSVLCLGGPGGGARRHQNAARAPLAPRQSEAPLRFRGRIVGSAARLQY
ncbi:unnamed protein product [Amoebophrya sp. A120]|nr:unnamed protein product [Amoebophrya sp. A120]|eukprot:GSA120T00008661001.1